jgi:uncharacterized protein DUF5317
MTALVVPAIAAVLVALALGGSMRGWSQVVLRWPLVLVLPFPALLLMYNPPLDSHPWLVAWGPRLWELCQLALVIGLMRNAIFQPGSARFAWLVASTGVALNALVVVANGGYMPVSPDAPAWVLDKATSPSGLHNTVVMSAATNFAFLGDVLVQPAWIPRANAISIGDILLAVAIASWSFSVTMRRSVLRERVA